MLINSCMNVIIECRKGAIKMIELEEKMQINMEDNIFISIDVETTGLSPIYNELIEISAIKYNGQSKIDKFTTLIKPTTEIPQSITRITGITNEMVSNSPSIEKVMPNLIEFIADYPIVAHNAKFDMGFLQRYSNNSFIDTVKISRNLYPELPNHKLGTVAKHIGITEDGFHRAEFDCECCAKIYLEYVKKGG